MAFLCELGLALGKSLAELSTLSAAEIAVWAAYRDLHGFQADRLAGGIAIGAGYVGACHGGKARPADLLVTFRPRKALDDVAGVRAFFEAHGAPVKEVQ